MVDYIGKRRIKHKFLWLPKVINGDRKWLVTGYWVEIYLDCGWYPEKWLFD
jgi:hypothetical protein